METLLKTTSFKHDLYVVDSLYTAFENLRSNKIDLVLLDLSLPDSTGFKTLTTLLEAFPRIPVVVLTGVNNEIVGSQSVKAGAQDFLVKGQFDHKILGRAIRYAIQRHIANLKLKESAKALAISEKRFQEAQEIGKFGNWEMDIVSNKMTWSDEVFKILKLQPRSIEPSLSDYLKYVHSEDKVLVENFFSDASQKGNELKIEHRVVIDGRQLVYIGIRAKIYFDEETEKILLMGVLQDISERKLKEQLELEKNLTKETTRIKENAIVDMGFHIRTPLSSVVSLVHLLEQSTSTQAHPQIIRDLKTSVSDLSLMVTNLLNITLLANHDLQIKKERFEFSKFCFALNKMLQLKAANLDVRLKFKQDPNSPDLIMVDGQMLTQVFYNLAELGFKSKGISEMEINIDWNPKKHLIRLRIEENGENLSVDELEELSNTQTIDEAQQNKNDKTVNATILNILGKLLEADIHYDTNNGLNQYTIDLKVEELSPTNTSDNSIPNYPIKVLLVEDHFLNQMTTKKLLTNWKDNITVDIAENGQIAVEKQQNNNYDVILMDIQMPVMNGIDAATHINKSHPNVPIIALTANSSTNEEEQCLAVGMKSYISKPFKPEELFSKITAALNTAQVPV